MMIKKIKKDQADTASAVEGNSLQHSHLISAAKEVKGHDFTGLFVASPAQNSSKC